MLQVSPGLAPRTPLTGSLDSNLQCFQDGCSFLQHAVKEVPVSQIADFMTALEKGFLQEHLTFFILASETDKKTRTTAKKKKEGRRITDKL